MASEKLIEALMVAAELTDRTLSEAAARVFLHDLEGYPESDVLKALERCRKELKSRLTLNDVLTRIDDGRVGADEAWAMIPQDESGSVVWTDEIAEAYGIAAPLLLSDPNGARMAFRGAYTRIVDKAKSEGKKPQWLPSLGFDPAQREAAILLAEQKGRLPFAHVQQLLPKPLQPEMLLIGTEQKPTEAARARQFIAGLMKYTVKR
jgi:hypothetical protein